MRVLLSENDNNKEGTGEIFDESLCRVKISQIVKITIIENA
jgi:hypothetical protein